MDSDSVESGASSFDELTPAAQVIALRAQLAELSRENNELRIEVEAATAERSDAAEVRRRYDALSNSTLGRVTTRYWNLRRNMRRAK